MKKPEWTGIKVGVDSYTVEKMSDAIQSILNSEVDESTKVKALDVLQHACHVTNTTISNCNLTQE